MVDHLRASPPGHKSDQKCDSTLGRQPSEGEQRLTKRPLPRERLTLGSPGWVDQFSATPGAQGLPEATEISQMPRPGS